MKKDKQFSIRISSQNLETIRRKAAQAHMSQSDYVISCCLGKKIIIENLLYRWSNGRVTLDCSGREALDDLVRPFYLLEGRNVPDFRSSIGAQYGEFLGNGDNVGKLLEGEYFTVRGYQKGTVHIVFKRPDLVEKLNDIIARHYPGALPPRV